MTVNVAVVAPAATVTLCGVVASAALELVKAIAAPLLGAGAVSVTVPVLGVPPTTRAGLSRSDLSAAAGAGVTVKVVVFPTPAYVADSVVDVDMVTVDVVMPKLAALAPCATVTFAGTLTALLALDKETSAPPAGAPADKVTVPVAPLPPTTELGVALIDVNVGAVFTGFQPS